ncbi:MAG: aminopeptidase P family protein [Sphingomonadaceae bacterium]
MLMQTHEARLDALRKELARRELDGFVIPISDEHMSEYVGAYARRLAWLTGFGGSAGTAVVLKDTAAIFVDGRYTVQVREQVDGKLFAYESVPQTNPARWIVEHAGEGDRIGYDPWLHSVGWADGLALDLSRKGAELIACESNPLDSVWEDRPAPSSAIASPHHLRQAGRSSAEKRADIADWLKKEALDAVVISALDSVAWLLNIRGTDVEHTPVTLSNVILHQDGTADLFIAPEKVTPELVQHLGNAITIRDNTDFVSALASLAGKTVAADPETAVAAIFRVLEKTGARVVTQRDPAMLPKAIKNPAEQQGHRDAQVRDGVAVSRFLHWLDRAGPAGEETELSAAAKLQSLREDTGLLRDLSFDTISAAGPHAALPHYRVDEQSNISITPSSVYLVDSGGQYEDGTTDITRTVWIGPGAPPEEVKDRFTRVLKGHIAIDQAIFPQGTAGSQLDSFARAFLWQAGCDFAHGTGHGVGSYLSVHEGPQRIAKARGGQAGTDQELFSGMILSNEPGYYRDGSFGIRIENLVLVAPRDISGAEGDYLGFETLTYVPIDRNLVDLAMLSIAEREWWNSYHAKVRHILAPHMSGADLSWLEQACAPL